MSKDTFVGVFNLYKETIMENLYITNDIKRVVVMLFLHDLWVNWVENEEYGYGVYEFHEWRKDDVITLLDKVPLLKVKHDLYDYIENGLNELPQKLLEDVHNKAYKRVNYELIKINHCFVVTDGNGVLAVDTNGYGIPFRKSRLIPRQEGLVLNMTKDADVTEYPFERKDKDGKFNVYSPDPSCFIGLTRREKELKRLLFMLLDRMRKNSNIHELRYWYVELNPIVKFDDITNMSFEELWLALVESVKYRWDKELEDILKRMVKGKSDFELLYDNYK